MHESLTHQKEKAARDGQVSKTAANTIQQEDYTLRRPTSTEIPLGSDGAMLGLLVLALQGALLPQTVRRFGWPLAEKWAGDYIVSRHPEAGR
jgi:hypothetical protein